MASMEENLLRHGLRRVAERMAPIDAQREALVNEVRLYDSPHWPAFEQGLQQKYIEVMDLLREEEDPVTMRVYQREARRLIEQLKRPEQALQELQELNAALSEEKSSLLAAAGLRANGAADLNGRRS